MNKFKKSDIVPITVLATILIVLAIVANVVLSLIDYVFSQFTIIREMTNSKTKGKREMQKFYKWLSVRVKSVHLADNQRMLDAYIKVYNNAIK